MNIRYSDPGLSTFYAAHRSVWEDFYPSERAAFELVEPGPDTSVLDVGSACGGLGLALFERFRCTSYVGIEIHEEAARLGDAAVNSFGGRVLSGDVLEAQAVLANEGLQGVFDLVVSLSALDWNEDVRENVLAAWDLVRPGGHLLMSMRLHPTACLISSAESRQPTTPEVETSNEFAPYVIMSVPGAFAFTRILQPSRVDVFGYWGKPSSTAITPLQECIFAVATVQKSTEHHVATELVVHGPPD